MNKEFKSILNMETNVEDKLGRHINILLSRHFDILSQCVYYMTGNGYTHASIGLEENEDTFYSFNGMGFRIEKPGRWKEKDKRIITEVYRLEVDEVTYQKLKGYIEEVKKNYEHYKYSFLGSILCILHIPYQAKYKYFCSQFIADALKKSNVLDVSTPASMFLPNSFCSVFKVYPFTKIAYC